MRAKRQSRFISLILVFSLVVGFLLPLTQTHLVQAEGNDPKLIDEAKNLSNGDNIDGAFEKPGVQWYKVNPSASDVRNFTHVEFTAKSKDILNISVYSSKQNALDEKTFENYRAGTDYTMEPAKIAFPYAWNGPYYIKVEYYGKAETDEVTTEQTPVSEEAEGTEAVPEEEPDESTTYTLAAKGVKKAPEKESELGGDCPVEDVMSGKSNGQSMLQSMRYFRDGTLAKSKEGRKLTALYYKAAPFMLIRISTDKGARKSVYDNLLVLQPLIKDLNKNGLDSERTISKKEQAAIEALYELAEDTAPGLMQKEMKQFADKAGIKTLAGDSATSVMSKMGIKLSAESGTGSKLLIKMKAGKSIKKISAARSVKNYDVSKAEPVAEKDALLKDLYVFDLDEQLPEGMSAKAVTKVANQSVKQIEALPEVEYVEKSQSFQAHAADIQYPHQWSLANRGQNGGTKGSDIQNAALQNLVNKRNLRETVIAVVDTGVDGSLADLQGSVDMSIGKNFLDPDEPATDDLGHGTHVAGIIAASANNDYSMAGINQRARIMPVKVLNAMGTGDTEEIAYGVKYAVDHGAKVVNLSLGGQYSRTMEYVLQYAHSKGVIVIAATGNENSPELIYPASSKYTISVGGTNSLDVVSDYSNYGNHLDLVAPGSNIPSLVPNGNVTYMSGTSMAAPHVSATVGLMLSRNPNLKLAEIRSALKETAVKNTFIPEEEPSEMMEYEVDEKGELIEVKPDLPAGSDVHAGFGRLNAYSAFSKIDLNAKVKPVFDNRRLIEGTTVKGAKIEVKKGKSVLAKGTANAKGTFSLKIPAQTAKTELTVTVQGADAKTTFRTYVAKGKTPAAPKVAQVTDKSVRLTGTAPLDTKVVVTNKAKKTVAEGAVDARGKFKLKIAKQKAGTVLYATAIDPAKRKSKQVKITVKKSTSVKK